MTQAKESVLCFIELMEPKGRALLFSFSHDVTEIEPLTRDLERMKYRYNSEDHRCRVEKDGNATCSYPDLW